MSLVDYDSSSDEEDAEVREEEEEEKDDSELPRPNPTSPTPLPQTKRSGFPPNQQPENVLRLSVPSIEKLPDASLLLNSPAISSHLASSSDHSSRVAAAMAESASRKRDANGMISSFPRSKVPRGALPHSKNSPDTISGLLVPPQLNGRSNVVTEDIGKLFVRRLSDPSSQ
ncbi:hypothetical protein L1049_012213 [Liquidambar formosana]|uniref:Uncharacterized protein n=1 Tax=Liquidambar formosana TaxID=63359 RepID=A0AAP0RZH0_LIQFO